MENNNSSLYAQKAVESFYLDRPYGIRIDYSRKGFVLFNRKLNLLEWTNGTQLRNYRWKNMTIRKKYRLKGWIFKDTTVKWTYSSTRTNPVPTITEDWIWSVSRNTTNISTVCQYYWAEPYNKRAANNMAYCSRLR